MHLTDCNNANHRQVSNSLERPRLHYWIKRVANYRWRFSSKVLRRQWAEERRHDTVHIFGRLAHRQRWRNIGSSEWYKVFRNLEHSIPRLFSETSMENSAKRNQAEDSLSLFHAFVLFYSLHYVVCELHWWCGVYNDRFKFRIYDYLLCIGASLIYHDLLFFLCWNSAFFAG